MRILSRCAVVLFVVATFAVSIRGQEAAETKADNLIKSGKHAEALAILDGVRAPRGSLQAARVDLLRSHALRAMGKPADAGVAADGALRAGEASRNASIVARARLQLAQLASDQGDNQKAAAHLAAALTAARLAKNTILSISVLEALGRNARARGDNQGALAYQGDAIEAAEEAGSLDLIVRARGARSTTLLGLGRFDEALADAQASYDRLPADAPARLKASASFALAQVQAHLWNLDRAVVLWGEALDHYRAAGLQIGVAATTKQRMDTWLALGELDKASADGTEALKLFERTGSVGTTPELFARLALIEARRGNTAGARAFAARAQLQAGADPRRRFTENDLGLASLYLRDYEDAASRFTRVHEQAVALGDLEYAWRALHMRGRATLLSGNQPAAERDLRAAVATLERMRRTLPDAGMRASFMSDRRDVYGTLAEAILRRPGAGDEQALEALAAAEQSRGRSLVEQLAEADMRKSDPLLERIRAEEAALSSRLTSLQQRIHGLPDAQRSAALADLDRAEAEYDALVIRLRRDHGTYRTFVNPEPLPSERLRTIASGGEIVVSYLFTFDGGVVWAMRDGRVVTYRIPERRRIESQVRLMNALVLAGDIDGLRELGASMFETLLGPARGMAAGASRLTVVPDGPLHRLPFGLLRPSRQDGSWLAETLPSAFVPSVTVLARLRSRDRARAPQALAAFAAGGAGATRTTGLAGSAARGTLEHAAREIGEVARLVDHAGAVRVMSEADETNVKNAGLSNYRVLHFAAHASIDETAPRRSAILLGRSDTDDGLLQLNEIAGLELNARLVVAAACRSHLGRGVGGEGLMSLSRAFLQAGADGVIATLWDVDDGETRKFMRLFYGGLRSGRAADDSLRHAQRQMIASGGTSADPRNWAGFVLTGSAASPIFTEPLPPSATGPQWLLLIAAGVLLSGSLVWRVRRVRSQRAAIAG